MRTGFESKDDISLVMQCGSASGYHGHADQGGFLLDAYNGHLVGDVGKYGGYHGPGSDWAHGQTSHSIVLIDGKGQADDHQIDDGRNGEDGTVDDFLHSDFVDYALANSKVAYDDGGNPVDHANRHFVFVRKPNRRGYVVIFDDVQSSVAGDHDYSWLLQGTQWHRPVLQGVGAFRVEPSGDNYGGRGDRYEGRESSLQVMFAAPQSPSMQIVSSELVNGQTVEFPPYVKSTYRSQRGIFAALLYPENERLGIAAPQVVRIATGELVGFHLGDDLVIFHKGQGSWTYQAIETDARVLYMELSDPQEIKYLITAATTLKSEGAEVFRSDTPVTTTGTFSGSPVDLDPPTIAAWYSAVVHDRGAGEALLEIPDDGSFCEPRSAGINTLVLDFSEPMDPVTFAGALVEVGGLDPNGEELDVNSIVITTDTRGDDTVGVITFDPALPDFARYAVRISGVTDVAGNEVTGDNDRVLTALEGDVSGDLRVNASDLSRVRAGRTRLIDAQDANQARADVTCDGRVNATDLSRVRAKRGRDARGIEDPILDIGTYFESDGLVTIECEKFAENVAQGGHAWEFVTDPPGYSRGGAMRAMPDSGTRIDTGYVSSSPRLDYNVSFETTGTWYVWVRGYAYTPSDDDSCHVGLNGAAVATSDRMGDFPDGDWFWSNVTRDGPVATLEISAAGFNEINVWMREDGLVIDKLILTTDPTYVPTD